MDKYARHCKRKGCSEQVKHGYCESWQKCDYFQPVNFLYIPLNKEELENTTATRNDIPYEADEQVELCKWCNEHSVLFMHIPNEAKRSKRMGAELIRQGMQKGFPDNFIPMANNGYHGLFIELKRRDKSKSRVSPEQKEWIDKLNSEGYCAEICYGAANAIDIIEKYLSGGKDDKASESGGNPIV